MSGIGQLFTGFKTPKIDTPMIQMPDYESPQSQEARRMRLAQLQKERGRESTILTGVNPNYSNKKLGQ